ncbi:hypothetical protein K1719_003435 [Acacia pycnantha]|nr:hypothetical protein K1719_003435 [Acacia pycnantha]
MYLLTELKLGESAYRLLKLCVEAGNVEACYTLPMKSNKRISAAFCSKRRVEGFKSNGCYIPCLCLVAN